LCVAELFGPVLEATKFFPLCETKKRHTNVSSVVMISIRSEALANLGGRAGLRKETVSAQFEDAVLGLTPVTLADDSVD
jgi:hypothetical protein